MPWKDDFAVVKHVIENWAELTALMASLRTFDPLEFPRWAAELDTDFYLHPGAVRYYREVGVLPFIHNGPPSWTKGKTFEKTFALVY